MPLLPRLLLLVLRVTRARGEVRPLGLTRAQLELSLERKSIHLQL